MGFGKIGLNMVKSFLKSGNAVGAEFKVTEASGFLRKHAKGISEEIGNHLNGKARQVNELATKFGGYDIVAQKMDEIAKLYPEATVKIAAKKSKQGFAIAKATVKNGEKTVFNEAVSVTNKNGEMLIKNRSTIAGDDVRAYIEPMKGRSHVDATTKGRRIVADSQVKGTTMDYTFNVGNEGEIANGHIRMNMASKDFKPTLFSTEQADGMVSITSKSPALKVDITADAAKSKELVKESVAESKENAKKVISALSGKKGDDPKIPPMVLQILRPLRERFNTAIDFFKYNGHTDFERFLSKGELKKELQKLVNEEKNLSEDIARKLKDVQPTRVKLSELTPEVREALEYNAQINSDIEQARELIRICC